MKLLNNFTEYLKQTVEIHLLKFLPSQFFLLTKSKGGIKIVYKYSFRDQSKEDDYTDISKNLEFLKFLHYQIHNFTLRKERPSKKRKKDTARKEFKSTHSATKSKMNQNIDSVGLEDRKMLEDDSEYYNLVKNNADTIEFIIPGFLIRATKMSEITAGKEYFSIMIFQRYIRRRRSARKSKDPPESERYHKFGSCIFPAANIKDRHLITSSFSMFIKNNLVVDRKTFMKATISTKQRKKIIAATRKAELELEDTYANALIQA